MLELLQLSFQFPPHHYTPILAWPENFSGTHYILDFPTFSAGQWKMGNAERYALRALKPSHFWRGQADSLIYLLQSSNSVG